MKTVVILAPDLDRAEAYAERLGDRPWLWVPNRMEALNYIERIERDYGVQIDPFWVVA